MWSFWLKFQLEYTAEYHFSILPAWLLSRFHCVGKNFKAFLVKLLPKAFQHGFGHFSCWVTWIFEFVTKVTFKWNSRNLVGCGLVHYQKQVDELQTATHVTRTCLTSVKIAIKRMPMNISSLNHIVWKGLENFWQVNHKNYHSSLLASHWLVVLITWSANQSNQSQMDKHMKLASTWVISVLQGKNRWILACIWMFSGKYLAIKR